MSCHPTSNPSVISAIKAHSSSYLAVGDIPNLLLLPHRHSCVARFQEIFTSNYHVGINTDTYLALRSQASVGG